MKRSAWGEALSLAGLAALVVGGVGLLARPSATATPTADLQTAIAVIPAQVIALDGLESITVTSESLFEIRAARPADAYAWATGAPTTVVRGLASWDQVDVDTHSVTGGTIPELPGDLWRDWDYAYRTVTLDVDEIEPGTAVVIFSGYEAPLGEITLTLTRERGNTWAWPVLALGFALAALGLVLLAAALIGFEPFRPRAGKKTAEPRPAAKAGSAPASPAATSTPKPKAAPTPKPAQKPRAPKGDAS